MYSANFVLKKRNVPIWKRKTKKNWFKVLKKSFSISKYLETFFCFCILNKNETKQRFFQRGNKKRTVRSQKTRNVDIPSPGYGYRGDNTLYIELGDGIIGGHGDTIYTKLCTDVLLFCCLSSVGHCYKYVLDLIVFLPYCVFGSTTFLSFKFL